jgi:hypothetical protein
VPHDPPITLKRLWLESIGQRDALRVHRFVVLPGKWTPRHLFIIHTNSALQGQYWDNDSAIDHVAMILMELDIDDKWLDCFKIFVILSINIEGIKAVVSEINSRSCISRHDMRI